MKFDEKTTQAVEGLITCDNEVMSGTPVFKNTRVPIKNLIDYLEVGETLNEFLEDFPSVVAIKLSKHWNSRKRCF